MTWSSHYKGYNGLVLPRLHHYLRQPRNAEHFPCDTFRTVTMLDAHSLGLTLPVRPYDATIHRRTPVHKMWKNVSKITHERPIAI